MTFYNEIEPYAAEWLGNLVANGHIASGTVETRSIRELQPGDVQQHVQGHFFAGIGVWSHALRSAGWPDDRPVWTGSCPCQPFSSAGRAKGFDDDRHLWPEWFRLIRQCRPPIVLGEQVASPDGLRWLDLVFADLEAEGYACGAADLCAAGVGAPHIRQRLYFVAVADGERREGLGVQLRGPRPAEHEAGRGGEAGDLAEPADGGRREGGGADVCENGPRGGRSGPDHVRIVGDAGGSRPSVGQVADDGRGAVRLEGAPAASPGDPSPTSGFWSPVEWLPCQDGRLRPVEPGTFPLAHGVANRVGKLRAYGNALAGPVATTFVRAVMGVL